MNKWIWIGGGVLVFTALLALLVWQMSKLVAKLSERSQATIQFVEAFHTNPNAQIRESMSTLFRGDASSFNGLIGIYPRLGELENVGPPSCNWRTSHTTRTDDVDGEFIDCEGIAQYVGDPTVGYSVGWRREGGSWRVYNLYFRSEKFESTADESVNPSKPRSTNPDKPPL